MVTHGKWQPDWMCSGQKRSEDGNRTKDCASQFAGLADSRASSHASQGIWEDQNGDGIFLTWIFWHPIAFFMARFFLQEQLYQDLQESTGHFMQILGIARRKHPSRVKVSSDSILAACSLCLCISTRRGQKDPALPSPCPFLIPPTAPGRNEACPRTTDMILYVYVYSITYDTCIIYVCYILHSL